MWFKCGAHFVDLSLCAAGFLQEMLSIPREDSHYHLSNQWQNELPLLKIYTILQMYPRFKLVQAVKGAAACRISLVLDVSGSMEHERLQKMNKGLRKMVRHILPMGVEIGITTFSTRAMVSKKGKIYTGLSCCHMRSIQKSIKQSDG